MDGAWDDANGDAIGGAPTGAVRAASSWPFKNGGALGSADGADGADDASVTVNDHELVQLRAVLGAREAELVQLKALEHKLVRLRPIPKARETELAQLKGLDHSDEGTF